MDIRRVQIIKLVSLFLCQLNMNLDVRLIQVNERMVKHKLLVAVADWVQNCTGNMQVVLIKSAEIVSI